jgi:hypothetical protein
MLRLERPLSTQSRRSAFALGTGLAAPNPDLRNALRQFHLALALGLFPL